MVGRRSAQRMAGGLGRGFLRGARALLAERDIGAGHLEERLGGHHGQRVGQQGPEPGRTPEVEAGLGDILNRDSPVLEPCYINLFDFPHSFQEILQGANLIGFLLIQYMNLLQYNQAATVLWMIVIAVTAMDYASTAIRSRLI